MHDVHPAELQPLGPATVGHLLGSNSKVLWVPATEGSAGGTGQWVGAADACCVPEELDPVIVSVARRAGLLVAEVPRDVFKVS